MHPAKFALSQLVVGAPKTHQGLSMFPLRSGLRGGVDYLLLRDALAARLVTVREVSGRASISDLIVENRAQRGVLIVDGEELVGAKQNRVVNLTLLARPAETTTIPVSCVEQGRWSCDKDPFTPSERMHHCRGRAAKLSNVQDSARLEGSRYSIQPAIWDEIQAKTAAMGAFSPTAAMGAFFELHASALDEMVAHFTPVPEECGGIFAIGGMPCGLDVFDKPATFRALLPKLVRSYGIDALEYGDGTEPWSTPPALEQAREFLSKVADGEVWQYDAVGLGHDIRIDAPGIVAGGLLVDSSLLHLVAFAELPDRQAEYNAGESYAGSQGVAQAVVRGRV